MARQVIETGNAPNDGLGDSVRAAGSKINANFIEVYDDISVAQADIVTLDATLQQLSANVAPLVTLPGTVNALSATVDTIANNYVTQADIDTSIGLLTDSDSQTLTFNSGTNELTISDGNTVDLSGLSVDLTGYATESFVNTSIQTALSGVSAELVNDSTPQLGANLDTNGNDIVAPEDDNFAIQVLGSAGVLQLTAQSQVTLSSQGQVTIAGDSDNDTTGGLILSSGGGQLNIVANTAAGGVITVADVIWPSTKGATGTVLKIANGTTGQLEWGTSSSVGSINDLSDVDISSVAPTDGQALVWDANANEFVPGGGQTSIIAPIAFGFVDDTADGTGTGISWGSWNSGNATLDFTFDSAQPDANYSIITDSETFDNYFVGITNKTTTGFTAEFYDDTQSRTPSSFSPFTFIIYGSTPTVNVQTGTAGSSNVAYIDDLLDVDTTSAAPTNGQVLSWNGANWIPANAISDVVNDTTPQLGGTLDANGNEIDMGTNVITDAKVGNWDTAYGWGDHSSAGYLTSYLETDTLDAVTTRGGTTTNNISVGAITCTGITTGGTGDTEIVASQNLNLEAGNAVVVVGAPIRLGSFTTTERNGLAPTLGDMIYNNEYERIESYSSAGWGASSTTHVFVLGANGTSDFTFSDSKNAWFPTTENDPVLYLRRGETYIFENNSGGSHPFEIRVASGGAAYSVGVTNNGASTGLIKFTVPMSAPATLYYQCVTHSGMGNTINIV